MKLLFTLLLLLPLSVSADKLIVGGFSYHYMNAIDNRCGFNEVHPAIGIERGTWETGFYHNSIENTSFFIAKINRPWKITNSLSAGYRFGLASGYDGQTKCESDLPDTTYYVKYMNNGVEDIKLITEKPEPLEDNFHSFLGILPQAQFIISYQSTFFTIDLGISLVSTLNFKLNL